MTDDETGPGTGSEIARRRTTVRGSTSWHARAGGTTTELNTRTAITLGDDGSRWDVAGPDGAEPVESASPQVRRFFNSVLAAMHRQARRAEVRPPVPKPAPTPAPRLPPHAPVPCPLCGGAAWLDCEICDGEGWVTQRLADRFARGEDGDHEGWP